MTEPLGSPALLVVLGIISGEGGKGVLGAEALGILEVGDQALRTVLVGDLGEEGPVAADGLGLDLLLALVEVVVKAVLGIPHEGVDPGLEGEIGALELEGGFLVVEDVSQGREIEGVHRHGGVPVREIDGLAPGGILEARGGHGDLVEAVLALEGRLHPGPLLHEGRHDILDPLLVGRLVVEVVLRPGEQRQADTLGVLRGDDGLARRDIVLPADGAVLLLEAVQGIQAVGGRVDPVGIDEEEGREDLLDEVEGARAGILEKT